MSPRRKRTVEATAKTLLGAMVKSFRKAGLPVRGRVKREPAGGLYVYANRAWHYFAPRKPGRG